MVFVYGTLSIKHGQKGLALPECLAHSIAMSPSQIICAGSALWDVIGSAHAAMGYGCDQAGRILRCPGGVALNIAAQLAKLGAYPALLSVIGQDQNGATLRDWAKAQGINTDLLHEIQDHPTDQYLAIEDPNGLVAAVADARLLESHGHFALRALRDVTRPKAAGPPDILAIDGNFSAKCLVALRDDPVIEPYDMRIVPASPGKIERLRPLLDKNVSFYVNDAEARALVELSSDAPAYALAQAAINSGAKRIIITNGSAPVVDLKAGTAPLECPVPAVTARRVTGAGDCFVANHLLAEAQGASQKEALQRATRAASDFVSREHGA